MSMELMAKAMKVKVGNPLRKLVLLKLADNANDLGECWPSYQHVAVQCEIDRSTVRKHIKALADAGLLTIENRDGPKGNSSNIYTLTLDAQPKTTATHVGPESTPVGPESTPVGQESTAPVGPESTRTSHSFEPINEPINEPKNKRKQKTVFALPDGLNIDAWNLWLEYRKQSNLKAYAPTPMSAGIQAGKLISLAGGNLEKQLAVVQQAIHGSWTGLYPLKNTGKDSKIMLAQRAAEQAIADGRVGYDYDTPFGQR